MPIDKKAKVQSDERVTRAQKIEQKGGTPLFPELDEVAYLVAYWQDLGIVGNGAMGMVPLPYSEIKAWCNGKAISLDPWEFSLIIDMSREYITEYYAAEEPDRPPPYGDPELIFDRGSVAKKVSGAFKSFMMAKQ